MKTLVWIALFAVCIACQRDPFASEYTTSRPSEADLIGTYRPDSETMQRLRDEFHRSVAPTCQLVLFPNRTFLARDVPDCFDDQLSGCRQGVQQWYGTWRVRAESRRWWSVELSVGGTTRFPSQGWRFPAMLRGNKPPYILHLIIDDPDSGNAVAFRRISPQAA